MTICVKKLSFYPCAKAEIAENAQLTLLAAFKTLRELKPRLEMVRDTRKFLSVAALSMPVKRVTNLTLLIGTSQTTYDAEFSAPACQNELERLSRELGWIQELHSFSLGRTEYNSLFKQRTQFTNLGLLVFV